MKWMRMWAVGVWGERTIAGWPREDLIAEWHRDTGRLAEMAEGYRRTCGTGWPE